jgi:hypothetical protein
MSSNFAFLDFFSNDTHIDPVKNTSSEIRKWFDIFYWTDSKRRLKWLTLVKTAEQ